MGNHPWAAPPCEDNTEEEEIVETTTVPEITTVAEIIEEGDSDEDDSLTVIVAPILTSNAQTKVFFHMPVIAPDFGCAKWKMVNPNYTNVPLDISLVMIKEDVLMRQKQSVKRNPTWFDSDPNPHLWFSEFPNSIPSLQDGLLCII